LLLVASAALGRFFCGWACPLGTLLDLVGGGLRRAFGRRGVRARWSPRVGLVLLVGLVTAAFCGLPLLGILDPLSLLLRSLTLVVHPLLDSAAKGVLAALARSDVVFLADFGDALYDALGPVLSFGRPAYTLTAVTALLFAGVLALELWAPRLWCSSLCPLGALLGVVARLSPAQRARSAECGRCAACAERCPSGAADSDPADVSACIQCGVCERVCPRRARRPHPAAPGWNAPASPTRRALVAAVGGGALLAVTPRIRAEELELSWDFLRPPGAQPEGEFRQRCIRCGACMRVCPRGALQPVLFGAGLGGVWTPRLVPRIGYCEYHCRLCGQVCPTGAIGYLGAGAKEAAVIGIAVFDRDRCLPYRKAENCMVCEEHCPTAPKAIVFREEVRADALGQERAVKIPRIVEERCIGCGICENKCPLPGRGAVLVTRENPGDLSRFY
jgi:MauM/NapG family ferredoxin protein